MKSDGVQNQLRETRTRLGLSQQELADAAGVSRQTIGGIEAGLYAPSAGVALRLAKALGCRVEELFWLDEDLPTVPAVIADGFPPESPTRVAMARIDGRWVAHPLHGDSAFRAEIVPADGVATWDAHGTVQVKLLDEPESIGRAVAIAGCAPALSLWARSAERWYPGLRVYWSHANSTAALHSLARGEVHAAGVHLCDAQTGQQNEAFVRRLVPNRSVVLITLGIWEEGFVVADGNPMRIRDVTDLLRAGVTFINREEGAGSRMLLDSLLRANGLSGASVRGYDRCAESHLAVATEVRSGGADAGVSTASMASAFGLGFVPIRTVRYDLALMKDYLDVAPVRQLVGTLHHRWVRSQLKVLGGYETAQTGDVVAEIGGDA